MARHADAPSSRVPHTILINRAPVVTLWATVVAQRLGHPRDTALTLGKAVAVLNAQAKGRRLGIYDDASVRERPPRPRDDRADDVVDLLGRAIRVRRTDHGMRAQLGGQTVAAAGVQRYLERTFGELLPSVEAEMRELAAAYDLDRLPAVAYSLYERFRPAIPPGQRGWGARGELDLHVMRGLRPRRARRNNARAGRAHHHDDSPDAQNWTKETSMGQARNSNRRASLDEKKTRAAGRQARDVRLQIRDAKVEQHAKGKTAGASGKAGTANRPTGGYTQGGGGGGGAGSRPRAAAIAGKDKVGRSSRPARKRGG